MDYEATIDALTAYYYSLYEDMPKINITVIICDNLDDAHIKLRPDLADKIESQRNEQDDFNGRMVLPKKMNDMIYILLSENKIYQYTQDKSMTWCGTFAHELTHAIDYYQMAILKQIDNYDDLENLPEFTFFQLWSEYHARKLGYSFLRNLLGVDNNNLQKERIDCILEREWVYHKNKHFEEYHSVKNAYLEMYVTMQLTGRYSVWCDLFPDYFNEDSFKNEFYNTSWMGHLFSFLRKHETLIEIYDKFSDMKLVLSENWTFTQ